MDIVSPNDGQVTGGLSPTRGGLVDVGTSVPARVARASVRGLRIGADVGQMEYMPHRAGNNKVAAAFAQERDAGYAMRLIASAMDDPVSFTIRQVVGEAGEVQMVVLEASCAQPSIAERLLTVMRGAHGIQVPVEALPAATLRTG